MMTPKTKETTSLRTRSERAAAASNVGSKITKTEKKQASGPTHVSKVAKNEPSTTSKPVLVTPTKKTNSVAHATRRSTKIETAKAPPRKTTKLSVRQSLLAEKSELKKAPTSSTQKKGGLKQSDAETPSNATATNEEAMCPIADLDIFSPGKRAIRAVVHSKTVLQGFNRNGQLGNRFSVIVADSAVDRMKITFFDNIGADSRYNDVEVGQTYDFVGGLLSENDPAYNQGCSSKYCFVFNATKGTISHVEDSLEWEEDHDAKRLVLINNLEPNSFNQVLTATVTYKGGIKTFDRGNEEGMFFVIELQDDSGTIRGKFFNEAAKSFYELLEMSTMYTFGDFSLSKSRHQYDTCTSDYEISFESNSRIERV